MAVVFWLPAAAVDARFLLFDRMVETKVCMAQPAPLLATVRIGYGLFQYERAFWRSVLIRLAARCYDPA